MGLNNCVRNRSRNLDLALQGVENVFRTQLFLLISNIARLSVQRMKDRGNNKFLFGIAWV